MPVLLDMPVDEREPSARTIPPIRSTRPPKLASEILRKDMIPSEPGRRILRRVLIGGGFVAGVASFSIGAGTVPSILAALAAFALVGLGIVNLPYRTRAMAVGILCTVGLISTTGAAVAWHIPAKFAWVTVAVCWLSASLLFRAFHRGSRRSRLFVGIGIAACVAWLAAGGIHVRFLSFTVGWQTVLPTLFAGSLALLSVMSLLAYMGSGSTGGCQIWGLFLVIWYAAYSVFMVALRISPLTGEATANFTGQEFPTIAIAGPLFVTAGSVAIAQLLATARAHELDGSGATS